MGLWTDPAAAALFVAENDEPFSWMRGASQWRVLATPIRAVGLSNHAPDGGLSQPWTVEEAVDSDGPILSMTTAGYASADEGNSPRRQQFAATNVHLAEEVVAKSKGFLLYRPVFPFPLGSFDGANVTLWKNLESLNSYAYSPGEHRTSLDDHRASPNGWFDRSSFTRFKIRDERGKLPNWP